jgi:hypothetical protein
MGASVDAMMAKVGNLGTRPKSALHQVGVQFEAFWELSFRSAVLSREESAVLGQKQIPRR